MEWKEIPILPRYWASNTGLIKGPRKILSQNLDSDGYFKVYGLHVHRLVCSAWHGKPTKEKPWALHKDGNRKNNNSDNLYWGTPANNGEDRVKHGNSRKRYKIEGLEDKILSMVKEGATHKSTAKFFGINQSTVSDLVARRRKYAK